MAKKKEDEVVGTLEVVFNSKVKYNKSLFKKDESSEVSNEDYEELLKAGVIYDGT